MARKICNLIPKEWNPRHDVIVRDNQQEYEGDNNVGDENLITFNLTLGSAMTIAEGFRVFAQPHDNLVPIERQDEQEIENAHPNTIVYTDGSCINNGDDDAKAGCGIWFGENDPRNCSIRVPGKEQFNQTGEIIAIYKAIDMANATSHLQIMTDSKYVLNGLTKHRQLWEDMGYIGIKNANFFQAVTVKMKKQKGKISLKWVKGHNNDLGNEMADRLAAGGTDKPNNKEVIVPDWSCIPSGA